MPALEQKLEMRPGDAIPAENESQPGDAQPQQSSLQIPANENLQITLVDVVIEDYHKAKADRDERDYGMTDKGETLRFDDWFTRMKDLYSGKRIPKTIPWKFCSNRSLRIAAAILDLLHARLFPSVWNEDLTRWRPGKAMDMPKAERISKFMDWWIRVWAPLRSFYDGWVKYCIGLGDALTETSWDVEEVITSESVPITDETGAPLVQDGKPSTMPKINRIEKTKSRFITKENFYMLKGSRDVQRDPVMIKETYLYKTLQAMEKEGACINITDKLEKQMHVPETTGDISPEEKDRIRKIKLRNMPVEVIRWYGHYDVDGTGMEESTRILVSEEHKIYLGGVRMRDITKSGRRPLDLTKYDSYLDRPEDMEGEGVLHKVYELSNEIDAIFNQMTDANTLGVLRPFFYDPSGDLDAAALNLGPNKGVPVTDPQRNVYFPPLEIPTERLINAIRLVMEFIERLTAASEYVMGRESGTVGGSGTATRTQAIVQSAETRFTLPSERLRVGASRILGQHLDIIQLNIPQGFEERVLGEKGEKIFLNGELTDQGISGEFIAYLLPDPSMGSKQTERDMMGIIYSILMQNPIVQSDPMKMYMVAYDYLKALGKDDAYITRWLGPVPNPDMVDDPEDENTLMIQGDFQKVTAQMTENHLYHIQKHMDLEKSPNFLALMQTAPELTKEISEYNQLHIQQHMQMMQAMMSLMSASKGKAPGGSEGSKPAGPNEGPNPQSQGNAGAGGMEAVSGPMGQALNMQRAGKSAGPQGA